MSLRKENRRKEPKREDMNKHVYIQDIEGFRPEWYLSTIYHCRDMPFWLETLDIKNLHAQKVILKIINIRHMLLC